MKNQIGNRGNNEDTRSSWNYETSRLLKKNVPTGMLRPVSLANGGLDHFLRFVAFEACKLYNNHDLIPPLSPMGRSRNGRKRFTGNPYEVRVGSN